MKGDTSRYCTRAEAKHDSDIVRRRNDKRSVDEGLNDEALVECIHEDEILHGFDCPICH